MKKIIALLLALVMTFSVATVAFAAEADAPSTEESTTAPSEGGEGEEEGAIDLGDFEWLLNLPLWTAKPMLKVAKIALKFVKVYLKLSALVNNIPDEVVDEIEKVIKNTIEKAENENAEAETPAPAAV